MTLTPAQVKALAGKLSFKHVKTRRTPTGQTLSYIEGWHAIAEANRIFGFEAWDRRTISLKCVWQGMRQAQHVCSYMARVRISVRAGDIIVCREGCGSGHGIALMPGEAHESTVKEAETDAVKRALATFGNPFGLALYDKEQGGVRGGLRRPEKNRGVEWVVLSSEGQPLGTHADPVDWCTAMRQQIEAAADTEMLRTFWTCNAAVLEMIRQNRPDLRTGEGHHFADILTAQFHSRVGKKATASQRANAAQESSPVHSAGAMPVRPRRIRNQDHLKFVASRPCLVCGRAPSHPHHIRMPSSVPLDPRSAISGQSLYAIRTTGRSMTPATSRSGGKSPRSIPWLRPNDCGSRTKRVERGQPTRGWHGSVWQGRTAVPARLR